MIIWVVFENLQKDNASEWYTAERMRDAILKRGHQPYIVSAGNVSVYNDKEKYRFTAHSTSQKCQDLPLPDCVISRTGADTRKATYTLYSVLERMGIPVINNAAAIALAADKIETAVSLTFAGLACPDFMVAGPRVPGSAIVERLGLPVVAKFPVGSCGQGVHLLKNRKQLESFLHQHLDSEENDTGLKFQRYIANSHGRDYRLLVIGDQVAATMERRSTTSDFRANASLGGEASAYEPSGAMKTLAIQSSQLLGLEIAGVDILDSDDGPLICEVNSAPGCLKMEEVTGQDLFALKLEHILNLVERSSDRPKPMRILAPI